MRNTRQKEVILDIVNKSYDHLTANEIYIKCQSKIPNISLGTVYRNLNSLVDNNKIKRIVTKDFDRYDAIRERHNHLRCIKCNKLIDIFDDIKISNKFIKDKNIIDYEILFTGICDKCMKEEK